MPERDPIWTFTREERIAYFSMEIGIDPDLPTSSGGLGMLAGDAVRSAADLDIPMVAVTLASRAGYFRQTLTPEGEQAESPDSWDPAMHTTALNAAACIEIEGRPVWVRGWLYVVRRTTGAELPVILLDTDVSQNHPDDRTLTHHLYGGDTVYRLRQEIILGVGGVRLLNALGFRLRRYHMNEGHSALLTLELLRQTAPPQRFVRAGEPELDVQRVRELCAFTTHTPVEAGHDRFDYALVSRMAPGVSARELELLRVYGGPDALNLTRLGLNMSQYVNGVAERHAETSRRMFPAYPIHAITNGVHAPTWTHPAMAAVLDAAIPRWRHEPEALVRADCLSDEAVWDAHMRAKADLLAEVAQHGVRLDPARPILSFARRMTAYKRPDLLFADLDRLRGIARRHPFQLVITGKAHPRDDHGKALVRAVHGHLRAIADEIPAAFVPNYDMRKARLLVAGNDVWLNTPQTPLEASGTSRMKAACNGVPSLSVLDGWWLEGHIEGVTGWAIGDEKHNDAAKLCEKLENLMLPLYRNRRAWIGVMKGAIGKCASLFSSHRMMRRYAVDAYLH